MPSLPPSPRESTPLLVHRNGRATPESALPYISDGISRAESLGLSSADLTLEVICPPELSSSASWGYALVVLLDCRDSALEHHNAASVGNDIWDEYNQGNTRANHVKLLEEVIDRIWQEFLQEYRTTEEIQAALWTDFPCREGSSESLRVINYLSRFNAYDTLLRDPIVLSAVKAAWEVGWRARRNDSGLLRRLDELASPRVSLAMHGIAQLVQLGLLISYVLRPPSRPTILVTRPLEYYGPREIFLLVISVSLTISHIPSALALPHIITLLAFLTTLPSVPFPEDGAFQWLLLAIGFQILQLHIPHVSPAFSLFNPKQMLPIALFLQNGFSQIIKPMLLFIPVFLFSTFLLSYSLADPMGLMNVLTSMSTLTPMPTRTFSLALWLVVLFAIIVSSLVVAATLPADGSTGWDRYGQRTGITARRLFFRIVATHSSPTPFPPPFNLLHGLIIRLPRLIVRIFTAGRQELDTGIGNQYLWRIVVAPVALVIKGLLFVLPS